MDAALMKAVKNEYQCEISQMEAERMKILLGSALRRTRSHKAPCFGKSVIEGTPMELSLSSGFVEEAIEMVVSGIRSLIVQTLDECDHPTASHLISKGVYLAGGGSLLRGLSARLQNETGIPFRTVNDPLSCVVKGAGRIVDDYGAHQQYCAPPW